MARYYVRRGKEAQVEGPWDETEIRQRLATGQLPANVEAIEATGQTSRQLKLSQEWQTIATISVLTGVDVNRHQSSPALVADGSASGARHASPVVTRYRDAYLVGTALVGLGNAIKVVGGLVAGIILLFAIATADGFLGVAGVFAVGLIALVVGFLFWVFGVIVTAQGQIVRATLDHAVASSPFMTDSERANAMGLPESVRTARN